MPRHHRSLATGVVETALSRFISIARRVLGHSSAEAQDLTQEAALRAIESGAAIRHPRAFFARIVRNIVIDEARKLKVRGGAAVQLEELPDHLTPWVAPDQETALLLKQIVLGLPLPHRDVFILNRFHGLSYAEIAERRNLSVKTVEYRMSRALALCEAALRD